MYRTTYNILGNNKDIQDIELKILSAFEQQYDIHKYDKLFDIGWLIAPPYYWNFHESNPPESSSEITYISPGGYVRLVFNKDLRVITIDGKPGLVQADPIVQSILKWGIENPGKLVGKLELVN